jgi:hypothetical protein
MKPRYSAVFQEPQPALQKEMWDRWAGQSIMTKKQTRASIPVDLLFLLHKTKHPDLPG